MAMGLKIKAIGAEDLKSTPYILKALVILDYVYLGPIGITHDETWNALVLLLKQILQCTFIWKGSGSCTLKLLHSAKLSTVPGDCWVIPFKSSLLAFSYLCRSIHKDHSYVSELYLYTLKFHWMWRSVCTSQLFGYCDNGFVPLLFCVPWYYLCLNRLSVHKIQNVEILRSHNKSNLFFFFFLLFLCLTTRNLGSGRTDNCLLTQIITRADFLRESKNMSKLQDRIFHVSFVDCSKYFSFTRSSKVSLCI